VLSQKLSGVAKPASPYKISTILSFGGVQNNFFNEIKNAHTFSALIFQFHRRQYTHKKTPSPVSTLVGPKIPTTQ
jgi:hypothetical protein